MTHLRTSAIAVAAVLALLTAGCGSSSKSSNATTTTSGGVTVTTAAKGATVQVVVSDTKGLKGPMTMTLSPTSVPAGNVTFVVKNTGTIEHEVIVLKTSTPYNKLPIVDAGDPPAPVKTGADKVDEAGNIGETGDPNPKPGQGRTFTIKNMAAGTYAVVCNIAKHYGLGMRAPFTVS